MRPSAVRQDRVVHDPITVGHAEQRGVRFPELQVLERGGAIGCCREREPMDHGRRFRITHYQAESQLEAMVLGEREMRPSPFLGGGPHPGLR